MVPRLIYYGYAMKETAKLKANKDNEEYKKTIKERVVRINKKVEVIPYRTSMIVCNVSSFSPQ